MYLRVTAERCDIFLSHVSEITPISSKKQPLAGYFQNRQEINPATTFINKGEQIIGTPDKPQCLVVQRLLSHLQYPVCAKSSTRDLSPAWINLGLVDRSRALSTRNQLMKSGHAYFFSCNHAVWWIALLSHHGFRLRGVQS